MAKGHFLQDNFTGGEWSPLLEGRVRLEKYPNAVYKLENFLLYPHGPAQFRPGSRYIHHTKDNGFARSIRFEFSVEQAYNLEFGNGYIRFYKEQAILIYTPQGITNITKANPCVVTYSGANTYANGDRVILQNILGMVELNNREFTVANINTGANTFELSGIDSSAYDAWTSSGTIAEIYEVSSPYLTADLEFIKYCQSADVLYLFHPDYTSYKLSRAGETAWTLTPINFIPPATDEIPYEPATTLTPASETGNSVVFTAGASVFQNGDVGRIIRAGAGRASITTYTSGTQVTCAIVDAFAPIGETFTNLLEENANHWVISGFGTTEYYLKNTAPFYSATKPDRIYLNDIQSTEGTVSSLAAGAWGWGNADTLGYNTIYVRLSDGTDPDSKSPLGSPDNDYVKKSMLTAITSGNWEIQGSPNGSLTPDIKSPVGAICTLTSTTNLFRSTDVGKYISIHSGFIRITQYVGATSVKGDILKELTAITATTTWELLSSVWTADLGYPTCGTFFEDRLCLARDETVWGSVVGDYENFTPGVDDDASFEFTLAGRQVNAIQWIEPREYLILGTIGSEWRLGPEDIGLPLTPTNVVAKQQTTFGCDGIMPVTIGQATLFLQRAGRKIREFTYQWESDGYVAPDMTQLAPHVSESGIVELAYQQEPLSILWAVTVDGALIGLTYLRAEDVIGWHRHPVDGFVESISVIPGDGYDELWAVINRGTINGQTVRYVEMMEKIFDDDDATFKANKGLNAFFVDSGLTYEG